MRQILERQYEKLFTDYHFAKPIEARNVNSIIRKSLQEFLKECKKPAIYCNGGHTKMLMADFMYELKSVKYIVDNYANKADDNGFKLIRDEEMESAGIDAVVISSFKFKDNIVDNLQKNHPQIKYLNLYEKFKEHGIDLQSDYYYHNHPYHHYHTINTIQRKIKELTDVEELEKAYRQLIEHFIHIKDFRTAIFHARRLEQMIASEENHQLTADLESLYENQKTAISKISDNNVLMLCMDGLRYQDLSEQQMPQLAEEFNRNTFVFDRAYSFSTSTYESLVPVYSENDDLRTAYYSQNSIPEEKCRFIKEAKKQGRRIYFYTDMDTFVDSEDIRYSGVFQTASEKMWNFILDAQDEENGLFYIHILYESHFTFSNPYTEDKLISEGTAMLFDFLPQKGGKLRTDYDKQHRDALRYLDDILSPMLKPLACRMLLYADHGNLILGQDCGVLDIQETKFTCAEEWIRIPYIIRSPEMGVGKSGGLISLMSLNDIVICLLEHKAYMVPEKSFVKIARSALYNPDFQYLYKEIGKEQCLLAFEAFVFADGYKLLVYEDGSLVLYETEGDEKCADDLKKLELFASIREYITVCEKKKLFFIINCYSKGGGAEAVLTKIVNHLNPSKYEIGIMEIIHDTIKKEPVNHNIRLYPYYVKADDPQRKSKMYYVYHEWDKVIQEYIPSDYDLYISFIYLKPTFLLPPDKKTVAWIHGDVYDLAQADKAEERKLQELAFRKVDKIVSISDVTTQSLYDLFPDHKDKIEIIYNGIDVEETRKRAQEPTQIRLQHPAILSVGRLDDNKNPLRLLDIFEKVYRANNTVHLYYLGYGKLEEAVKERAKEKGIAANVHLLGYHDNPFPIIAQCDVSCMFSHSEGFPMALLESVALDKPFVSSVVGGSRILANGQRCGRTVETDAEAVEAILNLLQKDKQQIVGECRQSIERFALDTYIRRIEELFDRMLGQ